MSYKEVPCGFLFALSTNTVQITPQLPTFQVLEDFSLIRLQNLTGSPGLEFKYMRLPISFSSTIFKKLKEIQLADYHHLTCSIFLRNSAKLKVEVHPILSFSSSKLNPELKGLIQTFDPVYYILPMIYCDKKKKKKKSLDCLTSKLAKGKPMCL